MRRTIISILLPIGVFVAMASGFLSLASAGQEKVTFVVGWYDIGRNALAGRKGIADVNSGWLGGSEVNRVIYDPDVVTVKEMENWLQQSGTFIRTVPQDK